MKIRVYYEDTDCGNVVYYANYLRYMERGRTELMREKGLSFSKLYNEGYLWVVAEAHVNYKASACYDDLLDVTTIIESKTPVSMVFATVIKNEKDQVLITGWVKVACILKSTGKVCRVPKEIMDSLD